MKKVLYLTVGCVLVLTSCTKYDFDMDRSTVSKEHAESVLGMIDPNQDWSSVNNGTITVTADANLYDVVKVQILTESPFMNTSAKVLAEVETQKGQTVTLTYDAPNIYDRLIAACIDSKGHYYIKGFDLNESQVSFQNTNTRTRGITRASTSFPNVSLVNIDYKNSIQSFNALRTIMANDPEQQSTVSSAGIAAWKNTGWENDRLWKLSNLGDAGNGWTTAEGCVFRDVEDMSEDEAKTLQDIFNGFLPRLDSKNKKILDNMERIRNSQLVKLYNNHLVSDGENPITIIPVQLASTESDRCHLYYYYFNPNDVPSGMSETEYIKTLPKFKAIHFKKTRNAAQNMGKVVTKDFFRIHEYLLPYFGDESFPASVWDELWTASSDVYRIRNGQNYLGDDYYMVYTGNNDIKLATIYDDDAENIANQLWQIYTTPDGSKLLYNIGAKKFLVWNGDWATTYTDKLDNAYSCRYIIEGNNIFRYNNKSLALGTDLGVKGKESNRRIATNKTSQDGSRIDWFFETYKGTVAVETRGDIKYHEKSFVQEAISNVIPKGYKIGLMLRKQLGGEKDATHCKNGCVYSYGELNTEINTLAGHFGTAVTSYSMKLNDTRTVIFNANAKTYIGFEDGADCQFSDLILEVGGFDKTVLTEAPEGTEDRSNGIETEDLYSEEELTEQPYMLCYEDRSITADYDMNDLVLRCRRHNGNIVELSLVATGGFDDLFIKGISGKNTGGKDLESQEVHKFFGVGDLKDEERFVNTVKGGKSITPVIGYYDIEGLTIPQFLAKISIWNETTKETIKVPRKGEAPVAIILPFDFNYPMEKESITQVYPTFLTWAQHASQHTDWYTLFTDDAYPVDNVLK